jgi:hypothetical protein
VPAVGPFLDGFSLYSTAPSVFVRLLNKPNRCLDAWLGLGVLPLAEEGICGGLRSGIIPRPDGAGVASLGDGSTGLGDGFLEGIRLP